MAWFIVTFIIGLTGALICYKLKVKRRVDDRFTIGGCAV